jgi:hypothetical protein
MASNINMRGVQEGVEDSVKQARDLGRKAMLATLGVAGLGFDLGKSIVKDSGAWLDKAESRGEDVEKAIFKVIAAYQKDFPGEVKKLAHNIEEGVNATAKEINEQTERIATYVQKNVKSGAESVSETVVDIKVSAEKQAKKVVNSAEEVIDSVKSNGAAAVKSVKVDVAATLQDASESTQEAMDSAVNIVWNGYDDLGVKEILAGLEGKSMNTLEKVREHELAGKNRVTVLREIDAKMQAMTS